MVKYKEKQLDRVFHALSDPTRRKIVQLVSAKKHRASELAAVFKMSFPAVSKHIRVLEEADCVIRTVEGRVHWISFNPGAMKQTFSWMNLYSKFWLQNLEQLNMFLNKNS